MYGWIEVDKPVYKWCTLLDG